jgi:4-carboxymuconolactone decarboxylase
MTPTAFPVLSKRQLDAEQLELWNELTLGPRGFYTGGPDAERLPDLYNAWLQFPEFGNLILRQADAVRARTELPGSMRELIVLTTSALLGARVEYEFHVPFARNEGLSDELIEAIGAGRVPPFATEAERAVYEGNVQLLRTASMTEEVREAIIGLFTLPGLMQMVGVVTLYVVTAYTTNLARVRLADDFSADPEDLKEFFAGARPNWPVAQG